MNFYHTLDKHPFNLLKSLKRLCRKKFDVKILPIYQTVKVSKYFQLKSATPKALCSNIVYQFLCACDAHLSYIGMSSRHLNTRAKEHLNLADSRKSAIKDIFTLVIFVVIILIWILLEF